MTGTLTRTDPALDALSTYAATVPGDHLAPGHPEFDEARGVWNAAVDAAPALVTRPLDARGVAAAVRLARAHDLPIAVRSGGHSPAGFGTIDGGVVIDLSRLKGITVDPVSRTARIEPGLTWAEVASELHPHGLALTSGDAGSVGVGGLALGGGIGWMVRKFGLTIDRLRAVELVTAEGEILRASATSHAELFWGLRGGGANFGIATAFEFDLHDGGLVLGGGLIFDGARAGELLARYAELAHAAPDGLTTMALLIPAPPAPFVPAELVGKPVVAVLACWTGDLAEGERAVAPLRGLGEVLVDLLAPMPYPAMFALSEAGAMRGFHHHSRTLFADTFDRALAETLANETLAVLNPGTMVQVRPLGGAMARVPRDATAFAHRDRKFLLLVSNMAPREASGHAAAATARLWEAVRHAARGGYGNFFGPAEEDRARDAFPGETYERLAMLKRAYDPGNVFARNVNVKS